MNLTIVTVNKNNAKGLQTTAESLNCSKINELYEWIVIDGNSSDDSVEIIKEYEHLISKWISEPDEGIYDAMNKGIKWATGDYVCFMNSGDSFMDLKLVFEKVDDLTYDIIYWDLFLIKDNGSRLLVRQTPELDFAYMLGKTINHQSVLIRRALVEKYPFNSYYSIVADWIQLFEIIRNENPVINYLEFPLTVFDASGISSNNEELRFSQRIEYLQNLYSDWELNSLHQFARIRQRPWYGFLIRSLTSPKRSAALELLSKWF